MRLVGGLEPTRHFVPNQIRFQLACHANDKEKPIWAAAVGRYGQIEAAAVGVTTVRVE